MKKIFILIAFSIYFSFGAMGQFSTERGRIPIENYSIKEYRGAPQIWDITQDNRGVMYFANNDGIIEYDGINWNTIITENQSQIRSFGISPEGRIYTGAENDIGYLMPSSKGKLLFQSVKHKIDSLNNNFSFVWKVFCFNGTTLYQSHEALFLYNDSTIQCIKPREKFLFSFMPSSGEIWVFDKGAGLFRIKNDQLQFIDGSHLFSDLTLSYILELQNNRYLICSKETGALIWDINSKLIENFSTNKTFRTTLNQSFITCVLPVDTNILCFGTWGSGIIITDKQGNMLDVINKKDGLADDIISCMFLDKAKKLWLGCSNGISRVDLFDRLSYFDSQTGINGTIEAAARCFGTMHIAGSKGLYSLSTKSNGEYNAMFLPNNQINSPCWDIISFDYLNQQELIIASNDKVISIGEDQKVQTILNDYPWIIYRSHYNSNRCYIGLDPGLVSIYRSDNGWNIETLEKKVAYSVRSIAEDSAGNLWLGTISDGVLFIERPNFGQKTFKIAQPIVYNKQNLPQNSPVWVCNINNKVHFATDNGLYYFNTVRDEFEKDTCLDRLWNYKKHSIHRITALSPTKLLLVSFINKGAEMEIGVYDKEFKTWSKSDFNTIKEGIIHDAIVDKDKVLWLAGTEGVFRYDFSQNRNNEEHFNALIRMNTIGQDSIIYFGTYFDHNGLVSTVQPQELKQVLDYRNNNVTFKFSAQNTEVGQALEFSYFLDGYDKKWSEWSSESKKEYTNLPENEYIFKVVARNVFHQKSNPGEYQFIILPPWYRTWWAYTLFTLTALAVIYLFVILYTRQLRQIIKERTAEIVKQKEHIEIQNEEIKASIKYAQRIQQAVCPSAERAAEVLPEHFVLWRPRDIVSGDYWWMKEIDNKVILVAADCTGHGVPGAFMSMLGVAFLNEIVNNQKIVQANIILNELRAHVKNTLKQTGKEGEAKDGMDLALVIIDKANMKLQFAGAYNPLWLIREGELIEYKADRNPIGIFIKELDSFTNNEIHLQKGDTFYMFSDGFADQFGGKDGSKYKSKNFKTLLLGVQNHNMKEQRELINAEVDNWRGDLEQVDDIIVIGIRF